MLIKYSNTEKLAPLAKELGESPFNIKNTNKQSQKKKFHEKRQSCKAIKGVKVRWYQLSKKFAITKDSLMK